MEDDASLSLETWVHVIDKISSNLLSLLCNHPLLLCHLLKCDISVNSTLPIQPISNLGTVSSSSRKFTFGLATARICLASYSYFSFSAHALLSLAQARSWLLMLCLGQIIFCSSLLRIEIRVLQGAQAPFRSGSWPWF
jgi:hypothetical protein